MSLAASQAFVSRLLASTALAAGLCAATSLAAVGCSTPPAKEPAACDVQVVTLDIYAADNINPNESGNPRPVVVRLYQLQNDVRMQNATYDQLLHEEKQTLGDDMLKADDVEVFPNDRVEVKFERLKQASTLAGVALFHGPTGQSFKTFFEFPLPPGQQRCAGREVDGGKPDADPRVAFFLSGNKIDNGSQFDETMFPESTSIRRIALPKRSAAPEAQAAAPGAR
jgi:type VI secretion system protein VasD